MQEVFPDILQNNKEAIFRLCKAYAASHEDAQDLFQDVLINIWQALPSFQHKAALSTWVYRIAINVCLRWKQRTERKSKLFPATVTQKMESLHFAAPAEKPYADLYACIRKLNDVDRGIILLFLEDLPYGEIAAIAGISENHVAVKIMRVRKKLFQCLK